MRIIDSVEAAARADEISDVYVDTFSGPPWNKARTHSRDEIREGFRSRFIDDVQRPGFTAVLAETDGRITGFANGWVTQAPFREDRAYPKVAQQLGSTRVERLLIGAFEVDELAVLPEWRGKGHGRALLNELVRCAAPDQRTWLLTWSGAAETVSFYRHIDWRTVTPLPGVDADIVVFIPADHPQG